MDGLTLLISVSAFLAVLMFVMAAGGSLFDGGERLDTRLGQLQKGPKKSPPSTGGIRSLFGKKPTAGTSGKAAFRVVSEHDPEGGFQLAQKLQSQLLHAGIYAPWAFTAFVAATAILGMGSLTLGLTLGWLFSSQQTGILLGLLAGTIGLFLPTLWLRRKKSRRHAVLFRSLPDFLDLLVTCLECGVSFEAGLQRVTDELQVAHPLLAGELRVVETQIELGTTPDTAMRSFAERANFDALRSLSSVLQQARRYGVGLAEALRQHAEELRIQREQSAEEKAQRASTQVLMPTMLLIFPAIFVVLAGPAAIQLSEVFAKKDEPPQRIAVRHSH